MWFSVLTLIVLANLHDGVKSNPLPVAAKGYVHTPNIGYHRVHHQATTFYLTEPVRKEGEGNLAIINSQEGLNHFIVSNRPWQNDQGFTLVERRRREGASTSVNTKNVAVATSATGPGAKVGVFVLEDGNGGVSVNASASTSNAPANIHVNSKIDIYTGK